MILPTHDAVRAAAARLRGRIVRTPVLRSPALDAAAGRPVLVKAEPLQRTGSFKLRGATNAALLLSPADRARGMLTHSSGNHGQAVACAAAALGMPAVVAMPADAPAVKVAGVRGWGAEIVPFERATTDREALGRRLAAERGMALVPPFDHPDVVAGQGTLGLELIEDAAGAGTALADLLVCTGGGGLVAGCALACEGASPATRTWGVEPEGWDDTRASLAAGAILPNDGRGDPLCDALLTRAPGRLTFAVNRRLLAGVLVVTPDEVRAAMRFAFAHLKLVVEPGGAVALAALLAGRLPAGEGAVGVVLSGGNVDPAVFAAALAG